MLSLQFAIAATKTGRSRDAGSHELITAAGAVGY